jgi:hypothetical protein
MFVATQQNAGEPAPSGYAQLPPSMMQQMGLPIMVPPEVVMAMRFIDMCNSYQRPMTRYYEMDDGEAVLASGLHVSDLHPFQGRHCVGPASSWVGTSMAKDRESSNERPGPIDARGVEVANLLPSPSGPASA